MRRTIGRTFFRALNRFALWDLKDESSSITTMSKWVPDRIVLLPGRKIAFVELKAPGKKPA